MGVFGLNRFFAAGAFGDDHEDRKRLLPVAVRRFREIATTHIAYEGCAVIGDTPEDIDCAKPYGATSIAVCTGRYSYEVLAAAGADHVFKDFFEALEGIQVLRN